MAAEIPLPPVFAAFQGVSRERGQVRRRWRLTVGISVAVHGLLVAAAAAGAFSRPVPPAPPSPPRVVVSLGLPAPPRPAVTPPEAPRPPRQRPQRPVLAAIAPRPERVVEPVEPEVTAASAGTDESAAPHDGPVGEIDGTPAAAPPPPPPPPAPPPPPVMTADQRRQFLARYLTSALRPRFDSRFSYPPQAEREGVEGTVLLRLTIDCSGRLVSAATMGACPSDILCEHAQQTTRAASPFPPPPRELGATIQVDMPVAYRLN